MYDAPKEHLISKELVRIRRLDRRLVKFDLSELADLKKKYQELSKEQQISCGKQYVEGREKLLIEGKLDEITKAIQGYQQVKKSSVRIRIDPIKERGDAAAPYYSFVQGDIRGSSLSRHMHHSRSG